ncbi:tryptophan halogenase family protein [Maricaulis sp. MIT060901]|uniref:tryptophan halogenase family protein n=1 Tax=Maricaulis sp. MIT060901 TaxID=3096993 RepID=UPI003999619B
MRRVVIVGGGSAGWIMAAYLNGAINARGRDKKIDITLVESPDVPRISVGEATVPSIHHVLEVIGIDEKEFMRETDASFKQSIKYVNWLENNGSGYHHPFNRATLGPIDNSGANWMVSRRDIPFMETVSAQTLIAEACRGPKTGDGRPFVAPMKYAYHFDAQQFADYLTKIATATGVTHVRANVTKVNTGENGLIRSLDLDTNDQLEGDIFVDCTGFKALLMEKTMGVPFEDFSQWLFCNQAVVAQFGYEDYFPGVVRPYTTATAMSAGWIWDTPTQTRRAIGYVHATDFISTDDAARELLAYQGVDENKADTRIVKFKVGKRQKAWAGNCIAAGLASGFIEPLESTGIYLAELAAVLLAEHFPYRDEDLEPLAFRFNRVVSNRYYEILDFINMHYCLTRRTDTEFWQAVQRPEHITDRLKAKLEHWRMKPPSMSDFQDQAFSGFTYGETITGDPEIDTRAPVDTGGLWNHQSYEAILYGMDFRGSEFETMGDDRPKSHMLEVVSNILRAAPSRLSPHHSWLHHNLGMKAWPLGQRPAGWVERPHL